MVGCHDQLNGDEFGLTLGDGGANSGRPGFDLWVGKIPWRRERLPTPLFLPAKLHGLYSPWGHKESYTPEHLSFVF